MSPVIDYFLSFNTSLPEHGGDAGSKEEVANLLDFRLSSSNIDGDSAGVSYQTVVLAVLLCLAIAAAGAVALATSRSSAGSTSSKASKAEDWGSKSAPVTRHQSYARLGDKFSSSERLDRVQLVGHSGGADVGTDSDSDAAVAAGGIVGPAELQFRTKLDLLEGIVYLHGVRLRFRVRDAHSQLDGWRAVVDICDTAGTSAAGCQRWRMEAALSQEPEPTYAHRSGRRWRTKPIEYVASLRLNSSRQLPHDRQLLFAAFAIRRSSAATLSLGRVRFPVHLVNEPSMEFCTSMVELPLHLSSLSWEQQHRLPAAARLHLGLLYSPGATVSSFSVCLVEVFDFANAAADAGPVEATVRLRTGATTKEAEAAAAAVAEAAALPARRVGCGAFAFDPPAVVLAIDNKQLQSACIGVAVTAAGSRIGGVQLGDFAKTSGPGMRQWNAAVSHPNRWLWLTHRCQ